MSSRRDTGVRLRTRIVAGGPPRLAVTVEQRARVRVVGVAYGFVRCGAERRWVWGRFDETFRVRPAPDGDELAIVAWGLGGRARYCVQVGPLHDLIRPEAPRVRGMPQLSVSVPRLVPLSAATLKRVAGETP